MTIIVIDGRRAGMTQCVLCKQDVTLAELAIGSAALGNRIKHDSANGYEVVHNECASRTGGYDYVDYAGQMRSPGTHEYQSPYGEDNPF